MYDDRLNILARAGYCAQQLRDLTDKLPPAALDEFEELENPRHAHALVKKYLAELKVSVDEIEDED